MKEIMSKFMFGDIEFDLPYLNLSEIDHENCRQLIASVLYQTVSDVRHLIKRGHSYDECAPISIKEDMNTLMKEVRDPYFKQLCDQIDIDHKEFKKHIADTKMEELKAKARELDELKRSLGSIKTVVSKL